MFYSLPGFDTVPIINLDYAATKLGMFIHGTGMAVQIRSPTHLSKILSPTFIRLYDLHLNRKSCGWCTEAEFFLLPQPQMCYVPTKGEGETNVSSKFVDDSSAVYKTGEMH